MSRLLNLLCSGMTTRTGVTTGSNLTATATAATAATAAGGATTRIIVTPTGTAATRTSTATRTITRTGTTRGVRSPGLSTPDSALLLHTRNTRLSTNAHAHTPNSQYSTLNYS